MPLHIKTNRKLANTAAPAGVLNSQKATSQDSRPLALEKVATQAAPRMAVSVSKAYREIKAGRLGPLVKLGARASAVPSASVDKWIADRIAEATNKTLSEKIGGAA